MMSNTKKATSTAATGGSQNKQIESAIQEAQAKANALRDRAKHLQAQERLQEVKAAMQSEEEEAPFFASAHGSATRFAFETNRNTLVSISDAKMVAAIIDFLQARINEQVEKYNAELIK